MTVNIGALGTESNGVARTRFKSEVSQKMIHMGG